MEFELGQRVLCRDEDNEWWEPHTFCKYLEKSKYEDKYLVFGGWTFKYCIPMEGNEVLIHKDGSSPDCPEKPRPVVTDYEFLERVEVFDSNVARWVPAIYVKSDDSDVPHNVLLLNHKILEWFKEPEVRRAVCDK